MLLFLMMPLLLYLPLRRRLRCRYADATLFVAGEGQRCRHVAVTMPRLRHAIIRHFLISPPPVMLMPLLPSIIFSPLLPCRYAMMFSLITPLDAAAPLFAAPPLLHVVIIRRHKSFDARRCFMLPKRARAR